MKLTGKGVKKHTDMPHSRINLLVSPSWHFSDVNAFNVWVEFCFFVDSYHRTWIIKLKVDNLSSLATLRVLKSNHNLLRIRTSFNEFCIFGVSFQLGDSSVTNLTECIRGDLNNTIIFKDVCMNSLFIQI